MCYMETENQTKTPYFHLILILRYLDRSFWKSKQGKKEFLNYAFLFNQKLTEERKAEVSTEVPNMIFKFVRE